MATGILSKLSAAKDSKKRVITEIDSSIIPSSMSQEAGTDEHIDDLISNELVERSEQKESINHKSKLTTNNQTAEIDNPDDDMDDEFYEQEDEYNGLKTLKTGNEVSISKKEALKLMRLATTAQERNESVTRKGLELPDYIGIEVDALLQAIKRQNGIRLSFKEYIISLICRDLISKGVFEDVRKN